MKKPEILKSFAFLFLIFSLFSCENEPFAGEYPDVEPPAGGGIFTAKINGEDFNASTATAQIDPDSTLILTGQTDSGRIITLRVTDLAASTTTLPSGGAALYNSGEGGLSYSTSHPDSNGEITLRFDESGEEVSGTFRFKGFRPELDENGMPVTNGGLPVYEEINITDGRFGPIPLNTDTDGGNNDDDDDEPLPEDEFFVKVDGEVYDLSSFRVSDTTIAGVKLFKIIARSGTRETLKLDIPRNLGEGIHQMQRISDGTKLIGSYKTNGGTTLTSNPGTLNIEEINYEQGFLKATFEFSANDPLNQDPDSHEITEGNLLIHFEGIPGANNIFKALVDGTLYEPLATTVTREVVNQYPRVILNTELGHKRMTISFAENMRVGTYSFVSEVDRGNEAVAFYNPESDVSITYASGSGTLEIISIDRTTGIVEGTFFFTAVDPAGQDDSEFVISEGEFMVVLP